MPYAIALFILLAPLPFGGAFSWFRDASGLVAGLALLATAIGSGGRSKHANMLISIPAASILVLGVLAWTTFQLYGEPRSPYLAWQLAKSYGLQTSAVLSLAPSSTESALIRLTSYIGFFWIAWVNAQSRRRARRLMLLLFVGEIAYAIYGLVRYFGDFQTILWIDVGSQNGLSSTFINRNTYATFSNLGIIIGIGLIFDRISFHRFQISKNSFCFRNFLESIIEQNIYYWLGIFFLVAAALLTSSRGGLASLVVAILVFWISSCSNRIVNRHGWIVIPILASLLVLMPLISNTALDRLNQSVSEDLRWVMWQQTIDGIVHVPLFGTGLGTFEQAYPLESSVPVPFLIDKAHNTYLEHALELGIPASLMFYTGFFALFLLCWRQRHRAIPAVGAASMAMVGTHALVDFSMQLPAVAMMFSVILGTACARACHVPTLISHSISRDIISEPNALDKVRPKLHGISETNHMRTGELL